MWLLQKKRKQGSKALLKQAKKHCTHKSRVTWLRARCHELPRDTKQFFLTASQLMRWRWINRASMQ
jgi:hypothetical protein